MEKIKDVSKLNEIAKNIRKGIIESVYNGQSGHPGGSLSIADIMTVLYFYEFIILCYSSQPIKLLFV